MTELNIYLILVSRRILIHERCYYNVLINYTNKYWIFVANVNIYCKNTLLSMKICHLLTMINLHLARTKYIHVKS